MFNPTMTILYVSNPLQSAEFYQQIFQIKPVEVHPNFVMFEFANGMQLALDSKYTAEPAINLQQAQPMSEYLFTVNSPEEIDALFQNWVIEHKITVIQQPEQLQYGYTFTVIDPDGHLRFTYLA